jgi:hypothetical protein
MVVEVVVWEEEAPLRLPPSEMTSFAAAVI